MIVSFALKNQIIRRTDYNIVVAQSKNYLRASFDALSDDWIGPITAIFNEYTVLLDANNECLVPWEVLQDPGVVNVSAFCGDLHTASVATMVVKPSGYVDGETPEPPTPDVYAQLTQMVQGAVDTANSVKQRADSGEFDGRPGEPGAAGQDGFSPIATVQQTADGATITITDKAGTTTATVKNGEPGPQGEQGPAGLNGQDGAPGPQGPAGQDAPQIDDTKITTANPWSSAKIVETVCPPFEVTGPIVTCNPVEGYPLHVVSQIVPVQEGEGDPSPDNVRPISGWDSATLTHNDSTITIPFGQTVYGGTMDWTTGVLTVDWTEFVISSNVHWLHVQVSDGYWYSVLLPQKANISSLSDSLCSHFYYASSQIGAFWIDSSGSYLRCLSDMAPEEWESWVHNLVSGGTPLQVAYQTAEPIATIQLTPQEILSISGTNNICTDTGDTTVSGLADPVATLQQLSDRIDALHSMSAAVTQLSELDAAYREGVNSI